jgi:N-dimethylarginine dimethylaminohydrolase
MQELTDEELAINRPKAYKQFMDLYNFVAGGSLTYLLPSEGNFQDQVYVANLGIYLPHIKDENHIILSNFTSDPRKGEEQVGEKFFNQMGYKTAISPYKWEGEADLKYLYDNVYIGGYGIRSNIKTYEWMEENYGMDILKVAMVDEYLYHLDCSIFALNQDQTLICTELYDEDEIKMLEKHTEIIDIDVDDALGGLTNSVRMGNMILCASNISEMKKSHEYYAGEKHKLETLEKICGDAGMEPVIFNLSEFMKSGAMLSCMMMHLNRVDHYKTLL